MSILSVFARNSMALNQVKKIVSVKEGEIVSLKMEQSRFTCPLARILRLYPGKNSCKGTKNS